MKFSYNWLREMVPALDIEPKELGRLITIHTAECEGVEQWGEVLALADVAKVISVESLGETHNRKAVVETKLYGTKIVVCGAPNCRPGIRTIYVPAGATLPNGKAIGKITLEGIESDGMLASGAELGINSDHSGIVEIEGESKLAADAVIEIDNKSLTHRPDLWGHYGMARETAAITGKALRDPVDMARLPKADPAIKVTIKDYKLCPRYSALVFENVKVGPSPLWLQARLEAIGLNPRNNVVDVTNLILAELPQPMHAFDADKISGGEIVVRRGQPGEWIEALDGVTYGLSPSDLVIADKDGPIAIAGIIGGNDSAISNSTTRVVLESANFEAASIRNTSMSIRLRSDASMRFEKAQDPENTIRGLARAVELLEQVCPGIRLVGGVVDDYHPPVKAQPIEISLDWLDKKLGRAVPSSDVRRILESLSFDVEEKDSRVFVVAVPTWRATKDISIKDDLVEEIGRMIGYGTIDPAPPLVAAKPPIDNPERAFQHRVREMAAAKGFTEVYNYSFVSGELVAPFGFDLADHVEVINPIAADQTHLRTSLLPRVLRNIKDNARYLETFKFFEIGKEIHQSGSAIDERTRFVAVVYAKNSGRDKDSGERGLSELRDLATSLLPGIEVDQDSVARIFEHPHHKAELKAGGQILGRLFEFYPRPNLVETGRAAVLDLDLALLRGLQPSVTKYKPLSRFPKSAFDLSIVAPIRDYIGPIQRRIEALAGLGPESVQFLYEFFPNLPFKQDDQKSVSFRITVGAADRTLSSEEVAAIRTRIIEGLRAAGYELKV